MSKDINRLRALQEQRIGKYTLALHKDNAVSPLLPEINLPVILTLLCAFTAVFFLMIKISGDRTLVLNKFNSINSQIETNNKQIAAFPSNISRLQQQIAASNSKFKDTNSKLKKLEAKLDAQEFTAGNLSKAKDVLYKRVSKIEAAISFASPASSLSNERKPQ